MSIKILIFLSLLVSNAYAFDKQVAIIYDTNTSRILRVIVSDDYQDAQTFSSAHTKSGETAKFVPYQDYSVAKVDDLKQLVKDQTGKTPPDNPPYVDGATQVVEHGISLDQTPEFKARHPEGAEAAIDNP